LGLGLGLWVWLEVRVGPARVTVVAGGGVRLAVRPSMAFMRGGSPIVPHGARDEGPSSGPGLCEAAWVENWSRNRV